LTAAPIIHAALPSALGQKGASPDHGKVRNYFIAADEVDWD
jgi:hypothetical protein